MGLTTSGFYVKGQCGACEAAQEVLPPPTSINIVGKPAAQKSTSYGAVASRAIDGVASSNFGDNSCTRTLTELDPWWRVDLLQEVNVYSVRIFNRGDCCGNRLSNFKAHRSNPSDTRDFSVSRTRTQGTTQTQA